MPTLRDALEAVIVENPDDIAAHMAYADLLQEQGDPRGELVQVQLALEVESSPAEERDRLRGREQELLRVHQRDWLGDLVPYLIDQKGVREWQRQHGHLFRHAWRRGWIDRLEVPTLDVELARTLAASPALAHLRDLTVEGARYADEAREYLESLGLAVEGEPSAFAYLVAAPWLAGVRSLTLGESCLDYKEDHFNCRCSAPEAHLLVARMPRLERLHLFAHEVDTASLFALPTLDRLRELVVFHLHDYAWQALADNPAVANLETLLAHPGHVWEDEPSPTGLDAVRPLFHSPHLLRLRHLALRISDMGDAGCAVLVESGLLGRLRILDLRHGCIGDTGARLLADDPATARLEGLEITDNQVSEAGIEALRAAGVRLIGHPDDQHEADDEDAEWRYMGDIE